MNTFSRRLFLIATLGLCLTRAASAGAQKEEHLADNVAGAMRRSIENVNPPYLVFSEKEYGLIWLRDMSQRLRRFLASEHDRERILINVQYEAVRAGLDPQLILGLIEVESGFRRYAISAAGARGLMQVMPFWVKIIGHEDHNLFDVRTNLRYGCTILRHYLNLENGDLFRALGRYNGSTGQAQYPAAVFAAHKNHWLYNGSL